MTIDEKERVVELGTWGPGYSQPKKVELSCPNCGDSWVGRIQEKHGTCWGCGGEIKNDLP